MKALAGVLMVVALCTCKQHITNQATILTGKDTIPPTGIGGKDSFLATVASTTGDDSDQLAYNVNVFYDSVSQWGYNVSFGKATIIRQKNIPSMPGNKGFRTKGQALKVGKFVAWKIINNIYPPSVSPRDLDSLGAL